MTARISYRLIAGAGAALAVAVVASSLLFTTASTQAQTPPAPAAPAAQGAPAAAAPAAPAASGAATAPAGAPGATTAEPGGGIVASVDGDPITEQDLDIAYMEFADQLANFSIDQRRDVTVDLLIHIKLLAKAAAQQGIDKEPAVAEQLKLVHDRALYNEYLDRLFAKEVTEDAARKLFDQQQATAGTQLEYHVAHILVPTKDEATKIITQLDAGADFGQLAKDQSIDSGSAPNGGDLGFIAKGDTVKEFETAAFALPIGKYTEMPVESQFGFHVIKMIETRNAPPKTFQDEAQNLQDQLAENAFQKAIDDLSAKSTIVKAPPPGQQPATPVPGAAGAAGAPAAAPAPAK